LRLGPADVHYGGGLVAGGRIMELIGDVATELCIRSDHDEGLLAGYSSVEFLASLHAGDFVEIKGEIVRVGTTSREMRFEVLRYAKSREDVSKSAAEVLQQPETVARATATCVIKPSG
jgi:3-aminobutyryl-CoA ammonia-lyase